MGIGPTASNLFLLPLNPVPHNMRPFVVRVIGAFLLAGLLQPGLIARAGTISAVGFTGDADSGVSAAATYTDAIDLNGPGETINGVAFAPGGTSGSNYTLSIPALGSFTGNGNNLTGNVNTLAQNFFYDANNPPGESETLQLTGLTPLTTYLFTEYTVGFGDPGGRVQNVSDSQGGSLLAFDENAAGSGNGQLLHDLYTTDASGPGSTSITFTFTALAGNSSMHEYGFSNQVVPVPEPASWMLFGLRRRWPFCRDSPRQELNLPRHAIYASRLA